MTNQCYNVTGQGGIDGAALSQVKLMQSGLWDTKMCTYIFMLTTQTECTTSGDHFTNMD